jgi:hypothetical protein
VAVLACVSTIALFRDPLPSNVDMGFEKSKNLEDSTRTVIIDKGYQGRDVREEQKAQFV